MRHFPKAYFAVCNFSILAGIEISSTRYLDVDIGVNYVELGDSIFLPYYVELAGRLDSLRSTMMCFR